MISIVKKIQAQTIQEHDTSAFVQYNLPFGLVSVGVSVINGRYPAEGFDVDTAIEQVWYVESGEGSVGAEDAATALTPGDMVRIPQGQKYYIEGNELRLVVSSSPPWTQEQHQHLS